MAYQPALFPPSEETHATGADARAYPTSPVDDGLGIIPVLSTYSGGGLMDLGFAQAGFIPTLAIEIYEPFARAYLESAIPLYAKYCTKCEINARIITEDISKMSGRNILSVMEGLSPKNVFDMAVVGILGGPPCQDFSIGGKNKGVEGERGRLVYYFIEKVRAIRPLFFVFENVKGLYSTRKHRLTAFDYLVEEFRKIGYRVYYTILNALEYGVPQDRERVFIVGFESTRYALARRPFAWPQPLYVNPKNLPWPRANPPGFPVQPDPSLPTELMVHTAFQGVENLPNQEDQFSPYSSKFSQIYEGDDSRKSFKRLHRYRFSPTVAYGNNEVHIHPTEPRRLSVREALRLQSVPDDYILPRDLTLTQKFKLVSNGVPTKLAHLLALSIRQTLLRIAEAT